MAPTKSAAKMGRNYVLQPRIGKNIVAYHNQLRPRPVPQDPGLPVQLVAETPGVVLTDPHVVEEQEAQGVMGGNTRPPQLESRAVLESRATEFAS